MRTAVRPAPPVAAPPVVPDLPPPAAPAPPRRHRVRRLTFRLALVTLLVVTSAQVVWSRRVAAMEDRTPTTTAFMAADQALARDPRTPPELRRELATIAYQWVDIDSMSRDFLEVLLAREDQQFLTRQAAFDAGDMWRRATAYVEGRTDPSGSTIYQQVAKNLFLDRAHTARRKAVEADLATLIALQVPKRRVLEYYANIIEFGPGIYGICAAAHYYFNEAPARVTAYEAATLVGLMPSPKTYTIYPASPTVLYSRAHYRQAVAALRAGNSRVALDALITPRSHVGGSTCGALPPSLRQRVAAVSERGHASYADDQGYWPRLAREWAHGDLPAGTRVSRARLGRLARVTPGALRA